MAFDEDLADRVRATFRRRVVLFEEKRMMGGLCIMVNGKMCIGVLSSRLMVRLDPATQEEALRQPDCVPMDFTGKPMQGFVFVEPEGTATAESLDAWVDKALEFNPRAKASRKKTSSGQRKKPKKAP